MARMCEKYGWTPKEYFEQDTEILHYFEAIARLDAEAEKKSLKK
jgi:hypothetical protein